MQPARSSIGGYSVIPVPLSAAEIEILDDLSDLPILEIIKGLSKDELRTFDHFRIQDVMHYNRLQAKWLEKQIWLLGHRLSREPTSNDLIEDLTEQGIAEKFRAFYVMKFRDRVKPLTSYPTACAQCAC